jgi:C-terminal processing protease CtpA/Prc
VAYLNFDMVGRLRDNKLIVQAAGSSPGWKAVLEKRNIPAGFDLKLQNDPYLPTDLTAFYTKKVPGLSFFTDLHDDYNRPTDDAATLNYEGMERIALFAKQLTQDVAQPEMEIAYVRVEQASPRGSGMGRRVFTGVVPDFSASGDSKMLVSDVRPGSPAEEAGLQGGDVIVEFAGKSISSLQDYADALRASKPGVAVPIVVIRNDERVTLTITPRVREQ